MEQAHAEPERVTVTTAKRSGVASYDVWIQPGIIGRAAPLIADVCPAHRYAVISDSQVGARYALPFVESLRTAGLRADLFKFPAGEWNKTRDIWAEVTDEMLAANVGRDAAVIALGGGVVGDLAGFVAATYMRGLPLIQMPTSLLAMVDSSVGGKTGVDTPAGKNLVGAFHQPSLVIVDPEVLGSLPGHQLAAGLSEALKHGLILDADYFAQTVSELAGIFDRDSRILCRLVRRSVEIKAGVVREDARESGYRRILNLGHTVAHGLEAVSGYELLHGEAVAIGLAGEAAIGEALGVTAPGVADRIREALLAARLPIDIDSEVDPERFLAALETDKKRLEGRLRLVLLADVGRVAGSAEGGWTHEVSPETVKKVLFG